MKSLISLDGELRRAPYFIASAAIFSTQYLLVILAFAAMGENFFTTGTSPLVAKGVQWWFWLDPLRAALLAALFGSLSVWVMTLGMAATLLLDGLLVTMAFRRANHAGGKRNRVALNVVVAALTMAPVIQIPAILWLSIAPPQRSAPVETSLSNGRLTVRTLVQGLLVGMALSAAAVMFSAVILHVYGYALFVASPFVIGLTTAYLGNREADIGLADTVTLVFGALALGALALVGVALEGVICLVMASPLIGVMGLIGVAVGRAIARRKRGGAQSTMASIAIVPLLMIGEVFLPPKAGFESVESIDVAAPPAAVWDAVVHMGPIPDAPPAPFRWGLAYPMRGEIHGAGVGAIRRGVFSTGVAYERVTEWRPEKKLSFIVLSDPPTMRELSPYQHVNAPHVIGYFRTLDARFTITPLTNGKTRLSLATCHELDLEPALYWIPFAEWATHANKVRVLQHFRQQAEASAAAQAAASGRLNE